MPYEYLDDSVTADVTFRATAADAAGLFAAAADATLNAMVDNLDAVEPRQTRAVDIEGEALDLLLYRFLGEIIFYKDAERLLLRPGEVSIEQTAAGYRLRATLRGETIDAARHQLAADVKAVTLHGLAVERSGAGWTATVTVDV